MELSIGSIFKYLFYTIVGYIFVGSPILRIFLGGRPPAPEFENFVKSDRLVIPDENLVCPDYGYNVRILSRDPLVIYIPDFLSAAEAKHMVAIR